MRTIVGVIAIFTLSLIVVTTVAQELPVTDSPSEPDTLDITLPETDLPYETVELDSVIYAADSIHYNVIAEEIRLSSNASMNYHGSTIDADEIFIDLENDQAYTEGETWMKDGTQILFGRSVRFDISEEKGILRDGASQLEKGFYYGREIRKVGDDVYDIDQGYFTTCESREPHFFIYSGRMRLYYGDKIVARPIIFYVNHFPILLLPFGTFSVKTERASGILAPEPGYNSVDGKYIDNIALYYAYDDYFDVTTALDWREKTGWEARLESNYIRRYYFNGDFLARYQHRIDSPVTSRQEWYMRGRHHSDFPDRSTLDANLEFMSSRTIWESSEDIDERLMERVTSSVAYRRPFFSTTLSTGANYIDNLSEETKQIILPTLSFSLPSKPVYELFTTKDRFVDAWWTNFNYSYSLRAVHYGHITDPAPSLADIIYKNSQDPDGNYINQHNAGIRHSVGLSFNRTLAGWLNFGQSLSGNEVWFDRDREGSNFVRGNDYSSSTRLSASIYGLAAYPDSRIRAIRHVMSPSLSFNYSPDFSHNERFYTFSGISLNRSGKQRRINFGLNHKWSFRIFDSETERERVLNDLFTLNSSISYDLEREGKGFSDISHSAGFRPGQISLPWFNLRFNTTGSARQDAYDFNIISWRIGNTLNLSGESSYFDYFPLEKNVFFTGAAFQPEPEENDFIDNESQETVRDLTRLSSEFPWDINFNYDYSRVVETGTYTSNLRSSLSLKLTQNWSLNYNNYVNLERNELVSQSISISRDMPCWRLLFTWSKQGDYWTYRLQFYNITLPDALRIRRSEYKRG